MGKGALDGMHPATNLPEFLWIRAPSRTGTPGILQADVLKDKTHLYLHTKNRKRYYGSSVTPALETQLLYGT